MRALYFFSKQQKFCLYCYCECQWHSILPLSWMHVATKYLLLLFYDGAVCDYSSCFMMELCVITPVLWCSCVWLLLLFYDGAVCDYSSYFMMELCVITSPILWWSCVWVLLFYDVAVCDYSSCFMMELCVITPPVLS